MQPIDGSYLFGLGWQIHPITQLDWQNLPYSQAYFPMIQAQAAINTLLHQSVFQVRTSWHAGSQLLEMLDAAIKIAPHKGGDAMPTTEAWTLIQKAQEFETVLRAELGITPMYYVTPKQNLDVTSLISAGHNCFPPELAQKAPEAIPDAQQAAKCIAFDLPTAAGFHLHRTNEAVLRRYFDHVAGAEHRPETRNMGDYLKKMNDLKVGDKKVKAALRDLKDLHRNPLMHPEDHIASVSDAIGLMGGVQAAMSLMLKELPLVPPMTADAIAAMFEQPN
jgi:hypothetical protein